MATYREQEIIDKLEAFLRKGELVEGLKELYQKKFINYQGLCKGSKTFYTELLANLIAKNGYADALLKIGPIPRVGSYRAKSHHDGTCKQTETNRKEEILAKSLYLKDLGKLGKVMDFQIPLKNTSKDKGAGKVDLFTYNEKNKILYLVELKGEKSKETALRAVLEIATYYQLINKEKFLKDYDIQIPIENIKKAVLFIENTSPAKEVLDDKRKALRKLMKKLNVDAVISTPSYVFVDID